MLTPFYGALFAMMLIGLSVRTLRLRRHYGVPIGPSREPVLERAMRVHANFCEYVPLGLLCMALLEMLAGPGWWIHVLGLSLLAGRAATRTASVSWKKITVTGYSAWRPRSRS